ncbi:acid type B receptor subunit 2 [Seminavis robusta]|uniref:Acid type B receptor subunit 2 n=1 Tax=Seminavis robusta TaxID=568900 RepID=A0A9N8EI11_9STRA|nr:acid type B receptor subunit 2 [Seminavis robusta]|eukprot:Sro985_g228050.1 acid type B receptor subunit 2 (879) ;mRNA; f:30089-32816
MAALSSWGVLSVSAVGPFPQQRRIQTEIVILDEEDTVPPAEVEAATPAASGESGKKSHYTFAVVPKQFIEFFEPTRKGCHDQAARLTRDLGDDTLVECLYSGPTEAENRGQVQAEIVEDLLFGQSDTVIDGMAISVVDEALMTPIMDRAINELNIPVITFDSDAPKSQRSFYLGTNNSFFGRQLARQMESLNPAGGTFGIISGESTNLNDRANGILKELADQQSSKVNADIQTWRQLPDSPFDAQNNQTLALEKMEEWASQNPTVLLSVTGLPMRVSTIQDADGNPIPYEPWSDFVDSNRHRNITLLCADASPHQLAMLETDYIDGLAGQLPYDMGIKSIDSLWTLVHNPEAPLADEPGGIFIGTNVLWHVHIPLKLPPITVDMNRVGNLQFIGYTLFAVTAATALGFCAWVYMYRQVRVVRVAQPRFLVMIAAGVIVMAAVMIPLGMDDVDGGGTCNDAEDMGVGHHCRAICMGPPWLGSIGFTLVFSALFSKTWRINRIFKADRRAARGGKARKMAVSEKDVLVPFFVLLSINVIILLCWTFIDPLTYHREADFARDEWNRVISTYGMCKSGNALPYAIPLILVNFGVLLLANWQAYEARDIEAEFAETKYITICMASMLQAMVSGVPVLLFVRDMPQAYYLVFVLLSFMISMVILLVIFLPKVIFTHQYLLMTPEMQRQYMAAAIGKSTKKQPATPGSRVPRTSTTFGSTISEASPAMLVRKNTKNDAFHIPEQAAELGQSTFRDGDSKAAATSAKPADVLQDKKSSVGWGGITITQVLNDDQYDDEDVQTDESFEKPVDVLKDGKQSVGWAGLTVTQVIADDDDFDEDEHLQEDVNFVKPVDVLKDTNSAGWAGLTVTQVLADEDNMHKDHSGR